MNIAIGVILLLVGFLNFYPLIGIQGPARLKALYGPPIEGADLVILMRHRALLFGLIGGFMMAAAFVPAWRQSRLRRRLHQHVGLCGAGMGRGRLSLAHRQGGAGGYCRLAGASGGFGAASAPNRMIFAPDASIWQVSPVARAVKQA